MVNVSKARINHINNIFILLFLTIHGKFRGRLYNYCFTNIVLTIALLT